MIKKGNFKVFKKDFKRSVNKIEKHTGRDPHFFAYPYGEGTPQIQKYLVSQKFITFSLNNGIIDQKTDLTDSLPRTMVDRTSWKDVVKQWVR